MTVRRFVLGTAAPIALAGALAACGDVAEPTAIRVSPSGAQRATITITGTTSGTSVISASTTSGSGTSGSGSTSITSSGTSGSGSSTVRVTLYPSSRVTMTIGDHRLVLPPGTICDPLLSTYGVTEWERACTLISGAVTITAQHYVTAEGRPRVNFSPALRFRPNAKGEAATLFLLDREAAAAGGLTILYCVDGGACVDESVTDPSVGTTTDPASGYLYRRLKHFSGYTIGVGRSSDASSEY